MDVHLGAAWKGPDETTTVGCVDEDGRSEFDGRLVDGTDGFIDDAAEKTDERVDLVLVVVVVGYFESIIEENVGCNAKILYELTFSLFNIPS